MVAKAFEMPEELRGTIYGYIKSYWDRPVHALFLIRGEAKSLQKFQTMDGFRTSESKFVDDYDMLNVLNNGGMITLATFTTIAEAGEHMVAHVETQSRFPFFSVRDLDVSDVKPLVEFLKEKRSDFHLMLDKPECYAEQYRHLLPEL